MKPLRSEQMVLLGVVLTLPLWATCACVGGGPTSTESALFPTEAATALPAGLAAFQQEILYDRRGGEWNDIMLHRTLVLINRGEVPVRVTIVRDLSVQEAKKLDLETDFGIMMDILPDGVILPAASQIRELPPPRQEPQSGGGLRLRWEETTIQPGQAVIAYYGAHFQDPATLVRGNNTVILPLAEVQAAGGRDEDSLHLEYRIRNTALVPIEGIRLNLFLPIQVSPQQGQEVVPLYKVVRLSAQPSPSDFIEHTMAMDGRLEMAEGDMMQFVWPGLKPTEELSISLRAEIEPTGNSGEVAPFLILMYHAVVEPVPAFSVQAEGGTTVTWLPTLQICNLGWPDTVRISF